MSWKWFWVKSVFKIRYFLDSDIYKNHCDNKFQYHSQSCARTLYIVVSSNIFQLFLSGNIIATIGDRMFVLLLECDLNNMHFVTIMYSLLNFYIDITAFIVLSDTHLFTCTSKCLNAVWQKWNQNINLYDILLKIFCFKYN